MIEENGRREIDIKRYARFEKVCILIFVFIFAKKFLIQIPGGSIEDSHLLKGVMLNKDVIHPKMKRLLFINEI